MSTNFPLRILPLTKSCSRQASRGARMPNTGPHLTDGFIFERCSGHNPQHTPSATRRTHCPITLTTWREQSPCAISPTGRSLKQNSNQAVWLMATIQCPWRRSYLCLLQKKKRKKKRQEKDVRIGHHLSYPYHFR